MELIREAQALREEEGSDDVESVIGTSMSEPDLERCSPGRTPTSAPTASSTAAHPRGFGTFPRVLGRYVRERRLIALEEAVRKMTALAADHVGARATAADRPGAYADLVLFDPATVIDRATTKDPHALSRRDRAGLGERPGRVRERRGDRRRPGARAAAREGGGDGVQLRHDERRRGIVRRDGIPRTDGLLATGDAKTAQRRFRRER